MLLGESRLINTLKFSILTDSHKQKPPKIQTSFEQHCVDNLLIAGFLSETK